MWKFKTKCKLSKQQIVYSIIWILLIAILIVTYVIIKNNSWKKDVSSVQDFYKEKIENQPFTKKPNIDFNKLSTQDE